MSPKHSLLSISAATLLALLPSAVIAGSVLVSNPDWQFIGPKPILGVHANYGGAQLTANSYGAETAKTL